MSGEYVCASRKGPRILIPYKSQAPVLYSPPVHSHPGPSLLPPRQWGTEPSCPVGGSHSTGQGSVTRWSEHGPAPPAPQTAQCGPASAIAGGSVPGSESPPRPRGNAPPLPGGICGHCSPRAAPAPRGSGSAPTSCKWPWRD